MCDVACLLALALVAPPVRGVALGLYSEDAGFSYAPLLHEIATAGANAVALVVNLYQHDGAATKLYMHTRYTAPDDAVARAARDARKLGLRVTLFPIVRLEAPAAPDEWRGNLHPLDRDAWWRSYRAIMERYAALAKAVDADRLVIGSELATLDGAEDAPRWRALVAQLRRRFGGGLLYSANWDHYREVALWDDVDAVGLTGYFPLADPSGLGEPAAAVRARAARARAEIERFAAQLEKPIFLTEVGFLSQRGAAVWPWREGAREPPDAEEQRRCYRAFIDAWDGAKTLSGLFFWNWYGYGGPRSGSYTPRGKPAAREIDRWFRDAR
jgi:hypothetical protein